MSQPLLTTIEVEGFTSIRSATVDIGALNVLVGANGAGKSNFIQVFGLLGRIVDGDLGYFTGINGGAGALLHSAAEPQIRLKINAPCSSRARPKKSS